MHALTHDKSQVHQFRTRTADINFLSFLPVCCQTTQQTIRSPVTSLLHHLLCNLQLALQASKIATAHLASHKVHIKFA